MKEIKTQGSPSYMKQYMSVPEQLKGLACHKNELKVKHSCVASVLMNKTSLVCVMIHYIHLHFHPSPKNLNNLSDSSEESFIVKWNLWKEKRSVGSSILEPGAPAYKRGPIGNLWFLFKHFCTSFGAASSYGGRGQIEEGSKRRGITESCKYKAFPINRAGLVE